MSLTDSLKTDILFKKAKGKSDTSSLKNYYEETIGGSFSIDGTDVFVQTIPFNLPNTAVINSIAEDRVVAPLQLTEDVTVAGHKCWQARTTPGDITSVLLGSWIPARYGVLYSVRLYKNNPAIPANEIPSSDISEWFFDEKAGVLIFQGTPPTAASFHITGYRYIGTTAVSAFVNATGMFKTTGTSSNYYIATTGSDVTGDGSFLNPYLTINHALSTIPDNTHHYVLVTVGAGTFVENVIFQKLGGFTIIKVRGSRNYLTPSPPNVLAIATTGSNTTITVATASWTPSAFAGMFVEIRGGTGYQPGSFSTTLDPNLHLIVDNDATTLTIQYNATAFAGGLTPTTFRVFDSTSILTSPQPPLPVGAAMLLEPDCGTTIVIIEGIKFSDPTHSHFYTYSGQTYLNACQFINSGVVTIPAAIYSGITGEFNISPRGTLDMRACIIDGKYTTAIQSRQNLYLNIQSCLIDGVDKSSSVTGIQCISDPDANMINTTIKNFSKAITCNYSQFQSIAGTGNAIDNVDYDFYIEGQSYLSIVSATIPSITNVTYGSYTGDYSRIVKYSTLGNGYASDLVNDGTSKIYYNDIKNVVGRYTSEVWRTASVSSAAGTTNLFTVPVSRTCIVTGAFIRMTADAAHSGNLIAGIGVAAGEDDIFPSQTITGLTTTNIFHFAPLGAPVSVAAGSVIKLGIDTTHASGSSTLEVQLIYQLI